jgi:hypothetical protein
MLRGGMRACSQPRPPPPPPLFAMPALVIVLAALYVGQSLGVTTHAPGYYSTDPARVGGGSCDDAMERLCEPGRTQGMVPCVMCAGQHKAELPNCSNAQITSFCTNSSCAAGLAQRCRSPSGGGTLSCVGCANCTRHAGPASGCSLAQQLSFCETVVSPSPPEPPSCDTVLAQGCDAERKRGLVPCAECVGAMRHAATAANCSEGEITTFCSNATCYSALAGRCPRSVGSAGGCQKCAACAVAVAGQSGAAQQRCTAAGMGSFCAPLDACEYPKPVSCGAHGRCEGGNCSCSDGYSGAHCEVAPDPCRYPVPVSCGTHGSCKGGKCSCTDGYSGAHCEVAPDPCTYPAPVSCGAHGRCKGGKCICMSGYIGEHCAGGFTIFHAPGDLAHFNGEYTKTTRTCNDKLVYQKGGTDGDVLFQPTGTSYWFVSDDLSKICEAAGWITPHGNQDVNCATSPDGTSCAGKWQVYSGVVPHGVWRTDPAITVVAT